MHFLKNRFLIAPALLLGIIMMLLPAASANTAVANIPVSATVDPDIRSTCDTHVSFGRIVSGYAGLPLQVTCSVTHNQPNANVKVYFTPASSVVDMRQDAETALKLRLSQPTVSSGVLVGSYESGFQVQNSQPGTFIFRFGMRLSPNDDGSMSAGDYSVPINYLFSLH